MTWKRPEHAVVARVLQGLDAGLLAECGFAFGGGTRIVLEWGEYRLSRDIDFLCSDAAGYARLRALARRNGALALFRKEIPAPGTPTAVRADQYGIRFAVRVGEPPLDLKLEFIREARIELLPAARLDWAVVPCLCVEDCIAEKLLANSDRWADRHVCARDLIDLAVLRERTGPIPDGAWQRTERAYGTGVRGDLQRALAQFRSSPEFAAGCLTRLAVDDSALVMNGLGLLQGDLGSAA